MKHFSYFIGPGAVRIGIEGSAQNALAFQNPDWQVVLIVHNPQEKEMIRQVKFVTDSSELWLAPKSFNTLLLKNLKKAIWDSINKISFIYSERGELKLCRHFNRWIG